MRVDDYRGELLLRTIQLSAEENLEKRVRTMIEDEMKDIVKRLTKDFMKEFDPQVKSFLYQDASDMFSQSLKIDIMVKDKYNPNN